MAHPDDPWAAVGARLRCTETVDGDLAIDGDPTELARRRAAVVDLPWVWLRQVHGASVVVVDGPAASAQVAGAEADALVTAAPGVALAVQTADCAPLALVSPEGVVGVAHAGWRGLTAGVVAATVDACRRLGASDLQATLGPCIHPECYRFGDAELDAVAAVLGEGVRGVTAGGEPALDVPAAVDAALRGAGLGPARRLGGCTACHPDRWWSYRARRDVARQATVVWREGS